MTEQTPNPADTGEGGSRYTGFTSEDPADAATESSGEQSGTGGGSPEQGSAADAGEGGSRYTGFTSADPSDPTRGDG